MLASYWGLSFWEAIAQAPKRLIFNPFTNGQMPWFFSLIFLMGTIMLQFVAIFWFLGRGGIETYMPEDIKTRFSDVWGQDHVLAKVKENIVFLDRPKEIEDKGGYVPSGILLWGPPGTGKTLMAEAVAGETGKPFVFVEPGAFIQMFFGIGVMKVRRLFKKLRKLALKHGGVIVFFDEADTLGNRGGAVAGGSRTEGAEARAYDSLFARRLQRHPLPLARRPAAAARRPRGQPERRAGPTGRAAGAGCSTRSSPASAAVAWAAWTARCRRSSPRCPASTSRAASSTAVVRGLPLHPAEEAAEVPHPDDHGHEHAAVARRRSAAARAHRPHVPRELPAPQRPAPHVRGLPRQGAQRAHARSRSRAWP